MARPDFLHRLASLSREGVPFAIATVVARKAPSSSHLGDAAIVFEDGRIEGYIGGGCSTEVLRVQGLAALRSGEPRLVRISPDTIADLPGYPEPEDTGTDHYVRVSMTCASQGALDLYVEPYVRNPMLVVIGAMPIADATAEFGAPLGFDVLSVREASEPVSIAARSIKTISVDKLADTLQAQAPAFRKAQLFGVCASMGEYDDLGLDALLRAQVTYIALVASPQRSVAVQAALRERGWTNDQLAAIRNPAGLDINAKTPHEVALSILAEIVALRRSSRPAAGAEAQEAIDPVCGMTVAIAGAKETAQVGDQIYYFCSAHCKRAFLEKSLT